MKRSIIFSGCVAVLSLGAAAGVASSDPTSPPNEHNCAGFVVRGSAGPEFGQAVSGAAQEQAVDNFGLANCGQENRNNP